MIADPEGTVLAMFAAFCRIGACFMLLPGFGTVRVPMQVRLFVAIAISFALLPILSAWENVELPLRIAGVRSGRERRQRAEAALALVGLERWATHRPAEMSGGQ